MGKIHKEGKWVPHQLSENAIANWLNICISLIARRLTKKEKVFISNCEDEKWIYFENLKTKNHGLIQANQQLRTQYSWFKGIIVLTVYLGSTMNY